MAYHTHKLTEIAEESGTTDSAHHAIPLQNTIDVDEANNAKVNGVDAGDSASETSQTEVIRQRLCSRCQALDLTPDKFFVNTRAQAQNRDGASFSRLDHVQKEIATLAEICDSARTCSLCQLLWRASSADNPDKIPSFLDRYGTVSCRLNWELDGRRGAKQTASGRTRRIHVRWSHPDLDDAYLIFVAKRRMLQTNSDSERTWRTEDHFLGRRIDRSPNNTSLIKSWLDTCFQNHSGHCRKSHDWHFHKMIKMPFFGVIDVFNLCLTRLPDSSDSRDIVSLESKHEVKGFPYQENDQLHAPYAALSYVWGGDQVHKTTTAKILHLRGPGSLETVLRHYPQVIKDAIDLTRRLGIRYLWVDSCCIVQDSERVWKRNAQHMDLIYGNAAVTICAADGSRADDGLYAMDPKTRSMDRLVRVVAPGVELMISRLAETTISSTVWNTRAWTFQERLLSKRCLIFAKGRVFFQCPSSTMLEDVIAEPKGEGWSLDLVNVPSQLSRDLKSRPFYVYTQCIGLYSSRKLTKQEDVLSAFTGVENMLSLYLNGPLAFGLPTSHFDLALLWEPLDPAKRRWVTESEQQGRKRSEFPSWSWCGWYDAKIVYKTELMRDIESHVHAWLTDHTWITWFIRDGNGYLRPLWNPLRFGMTDEHKETDARWEGYAQADTGNVGFVLRPHHDREESESEAASTASAHRRRSPSPQRVVKMITRPRDGNASAPQPDYYNRDDYGHNYYHTVKDAQTSYPQHARGVYGNDSYQAPPYNYGGHPYPGHYPPDYDYRRRQHQHHDFSRPRQRHNDNRSDVGDAAFAELPIPRPDYQNDQGRGNRSSQRGKHTDRFWITTPESPYTVKTTEYQAQPDKEFPDYPILQFWTWSAHLRIARAASETSVQHDKPALHQYDIHDEAGDWCGSILLQSDWVAEWEKDNEESIEGSKHEFLALSDAKRFTSKECETWTYYIPKEREQSEWDLYYVLLVSRNRLFWHRVALGKVFKAAFDNGAPSKNWKEIVLA